MVKFLVVLTFLLGGDPGLGANPIDRQSTVKIYSGDRPDFSFESQRSFWIIGRQPSYQGVVAYMSFSGFFEYSVPELERPRRDIEAVVCGRKAYISVWSVKPKSAGRLSSFLSCSNLARDRLDDSVYSRSASLEIRDSSGASEIRIGATLGLQEETSLYWLNDTNDPALLRFDSKYRVPAMNLFWNRNSVALYLGGGSGLVNILLVGIGPCVPEFVESLKSQVEADAFSRLLIQAYGQAESNLLIDTQSNGDSHFPVACGVPPNKVLGSARLNNGG